MSGKILVPEGFSLWDYRCDYLSNHDGDSVTLVLDQGFGNSKVTQDGLRLGGVFAPELSQVGGADVRDFVEDWFTVRQNYSIINEWPFVVRTEMTKGGTRERVTFGRYIGLVWLPGETITLNQAINDYTITRDYPRGTGYKPPT